MPTLEICTLSLVAGCDIKDPNSAETKVFQECCDIMASQEGMQKLWYGTTVQNPGTLQLFLKWNTKSAHEKFMAADTYKPFREKVDKLCAGPPDVVHVDFQPGGGVEEALTAPVTEVATFYYNEAPPSTAYEGAKTLIDALKNADQKILGWGFGTTYEMIEKDGVKGKGNLLLVGWETVEAHMASHETQALKENIHLLTTAEVKGLEMHHVQATAYQG